MAFAIVTNPGQPSEYPSRENSFPPVDPYTPINYPEYPSTHPPQPPQPPQPVYPPPYQGGPPGYRVPPGYPDPYNPYQVPYRGTSAATNGLAIGSLVTSITGLLLGVPLTFFCYVGLLIPIVGIVLGIVALNQINRTNQQGRGLAIAGIAVGGAAIALVLIVTLIVVSYFAHAH